MSKPIDPATRIGHVHLKVSDLERALAFYCGVLGLELEQRYGSEAAFVSAGGYHHHIGLRTRPTTCAFAPNSKAICRLERPRAAKTSISARLATFTAVFRLRKIRSHSLRSPSSSTNESLVAGIHRLYIN